VRKEATKAISWIIVAVVVLSALWVMWICPGIIAKLIITVAVIASLLSALVEDIKKVKNIDWLFVLFWFLIACAYGAIIVGALMNGWVLFLVIVGVLSAVALVGAGGK